MTSSDRDLIKFVKEMKGRQMRKKRCTSKTCIEKSSILSVDVHVANNSLVFCCYICICCLKLHQADYHVEEIFCFFVGRWVEGGGGGGGGVGGLPQYGGGTLHSAPMYLLFGA